jgi:hypothetical protein
LCNCSRHDVSRHVREEEKNLPISVERRRNTEAKRERERKAEREKQGRIKKKSKRRL